MLNNVNLADIRSFVLIAKLGNFTKAAEALDVSRSHVSRQISHLEKQMKVTLLIRTTRSLKLTEAGKSFYLQCERALADIDQAVLAAVDDVEKVQGEIRVNCVGGYLGEELIAQITCDFMSLYPDTQVSLDFSSHRVDLLEEDFDIAFRMGSLEDSGFIARKLMTIKMSTLASPKYLTVHGKLAHPKELAHHQCLTGSVKRWGFSHRTTKARTELAIQGHLRCKNGRVLVKGAINHQGIIRVPSLYCQEEIEAGKLIEVFDEWTIPSVDFSAIYHRDRYQPKRLRVFIDFVKQQFDTLSV
ncbi:LysR family transcriptional regulator [Vibrio bivalvicida]|uniref:LysR family transcriptional regulator n=1 Tax=Vibrio bivalvicida TaxID=1276888 RepID=A0ABV4MDW6_9VIBR